MKKLILTFAMAISGVALATPSYWAAAETAAAKGDKSGGANVALYSGYYCTVETAAKLFKLNELTSENAIDKFTAYFADSKSRFFSAQTVLQEKSAEYKGGAGAAGALSSVSSANGQYELSATYGDALVSSAYLAMLFYENGKDLQVRVMMNDVTGYDMTQGNVAFNDSSAATAGTFGAWTAAPEPTSGLLMLLGMAGLALKRKRA